MSAERPFVRQWLWRLAMLGSIAISVVFLRERVGVIPFAAAMLLMSLVIYRVLLAIAAVVFRARRSRQVSGRETASERTSPR